MTLVTRCVCTDRSFAELLALARARGLDAEALGSATGAGRRCTLCRPYLDIVLRTGATAIPLLPPQGTRAPDHDPRNDCNRGRDREP